MRESDVGMYNYIKGCEVEMIFNCCLWTERTFDKHDIMYPIITIGILIVKKELNVWSYWFNGNRDY